MSEESVKIPKDDEDCCYNCRYFKDTEWTKPYQEVSKISRVPVIKKMKIADGGCRRFPRAEPINYTDWCGEFAWIKK